MQLRSVKIINELNVIILSLVTRIEMGVAQACSAGVILE